MRHSSISVRWPMYRGRGAGRWAESSSGACGLPYKPPPPPPACVRTAATRDEPEGTRSLPCWPCHAVAVAAVWTGVAKALRARPPLGQRSSPRRRRPLREGGGGVRGACPPLTWWPLADSASDPGGGGGVVAVAMRGYSRPLRCG